MFNADAKLAQSSLSLLAAPESPAPTIAFINMPAAFDDPLRPWIIIAVRQKHDAYRALLNHYVLE